MSLMFISLQPQSMGFTRWQCPVRWFIGLSVAWNAYYWWWWGLIASAIWATLTFTRYCMRLYFMYYIRIWRSVAIKYLDQCQLHILTVLTV